MPAVGRMAPSPPVAGMVGPCISGAGERIGRTRIHHPPGGATTATGGATLTDTGATTHPANNSIPVMMATDFI